MVQKHQDNGKVRDEAANDRERLKENSDEVTIQSDDSFPASDPPSFTPVKGPTGEKGNDKKKQPA